MRSLIADGLVDELRLLVAPIVVGGGARLFPEGTARTTFAPTAASTLGGGLIALPWSRRAPALDPPATAA